MLLTGPPGIGKSTLMRKVIDLHTGSLGGLLCLEKRDSQTSKRIGFSTVNSKGEEKIFMAKSNELQDNKKSPVQSMDQNATSISPPLSAAATARIADRATTEPPAIPPARVGSYIVDLDVINTFMVAELDNCISKTPDLVYIDEIGRAQSHSSLFFNRVNSLFQLERCNILATIVEQDTHGTQWSLVFKYSPQSWLIRVEEKNRNFLAPIIAALVSNYHTFERLSISQQNKTKQLFYDLLLTGQFVSAKKLFSNAIGYVCDNKIKPVSPAIVECSQTKDGVPVETTTQVYHVIGKTNGHTLRKITTTTVATTATVTDATDDGNVTLVSERFTCDCDLSRGLGSFAALQREDTVYQRGDSDSNNSNSESTTSMSACTHNGNNKIQSDVDYDRRHSATTDTTAAVVGQTCSHELAAILSES